MHFATTYIMLVSALASTPDPIFGDVNHRPIPAVITQLDVLEQLSADAFAPLAGSVLRLVDNSKAQVVRIRALQVACSRGDAALARNLAAALGQRLDVIGNQGRDHVSDSLVLHAVTTRRASHWSDAMRASPEMRAVLMRLARWPVALQGGGDPTASHASVYRLLELSADDAGKRAVLMQIITAKGLGAEPASWESVPLVDAATRASMRSLISVVPVNEYAARILGEIGDSQALEIASQQIANGITLAGGRSALNEMQWKIEAQTPPEHLVAAIMTPDAMFMYREWALQRAVDLGVSKPVLKDAIVAWAARVAPAQVCFMKHRAVALGVMNSSDLPSVPAFRALGGCAIYDRNEPEAPLVIPNRGSKTAPWKPTVQNIEQFCLWHRAQNWRGVSQAERIQRMSRKMCELDLLNPETCDELASSQPRVP